MIHIDISKAGIDPMAEMTDKEYENAREKYLDIVQIVMPDWAYAESDENYLNLYADDDHTDDDLQEIANEAWEHFCGVHSK